MNCAGLVARMGRVEICAEFCGESKGKDSIWLIENYMGLY